MNKEKIIGLLFPEASSKTADRLILGLRLMFGIMLLTHGITKIVNFGATAPMFPDPLGVGSAVSLGLAIFAEVGCSLALLLGLLTRPACLVLAFNMFVAIAAVHHFDILGAGELAFLYFVIFMAILLTGAGRYSVDHLLRSRLQAGAYM